MKQNCKPEREKIISVLLELAVVLSGTAALVLVGRTGQFINGDNMFLYYTIQSNVLAGAACLLFAGVKMAEIISGRALRHKWMYVFKYISVVSVSLTFVVFGAILAPLQPRELLSSWGSILMHFVSPLLAALDFILFDYEFKTGRYSCLYACITPVLYLFFVLGCVRCGIPFLADGTRFPYFFVNYEQFGWFRINGKELGVFYWMLILLVLVLLLGQILIGIKNSMYRKKCLK